MNISSFLIGYQTGKNAGGGSSDDLRYVTFMSYDGKAEYGKKAVAVGDDCADPIARGVFSTPTRESTVQYNYTFAGWATTANGGLNSNALKAVNEDRTVYANFAAVVRKYTITYLDTDGSVLKTESLAYGSMPSYTPTKAGFIFKGWDTSPVAVVGNATYTAVWEVANFETATWAEIAEASASGNASSIYKLGATKTISIGGVDVTLEIAGFDHDNLSDGSGKAGISIIAKTLLANDLALYDTSHPATGKWENSAIRQWMVNDLMELLPSDLKAAIKPVDKISPTTKDGSLVTLSEKVWAPAIEEMVEIPNNLPSGTNADNFLVRGQGNKYALYTSSTKRIRYKPDGTAYFGNTRSRSKQNSSVHWSVNKTGSYSEATTGIKGIIIGFCI